MQGGVACETIPQLGLVSLSLVNWVCSFIYRNFLLHLSPNRKIFSSDFAAYVVDGSNNEERHPVDMDEFYHGYLDGKSFGTREGGRESLGRVREEGGRYHCSHFVTVFGKREEWEPGERGG